MKKLDQPFAHLHVHTGYSLLDGSAKIKELVGRVKDLGMDAVAITDHGVMYGVVEFYKEALAQGIKPIIGCEVYVAPRARTEKAATPEGIYYHLVLLAENETGYKNLMKLVSLGFTEGFYYRPRVDEELLNQYHEGLIALSACLAGPIAKNLLRSTYDKAKEMALRYEKIFGPGNFFIELQDHGLNDQKTVNPLLMKIHQETGIPLVATNDIHYIDEQDAKAHEILLCIQTGKTMQDEDRMIYEGHQNYVKSPGEMYALFPYARQALENTAKIAERCQLELHFHEYKLPKFPLPQGKDSGTYLRELVAEGLEKRYPNPGDFVKERMAYEIKTIEDMGFTDYFLIVWDFIKYAKDHGISVGPGRGSAAGSIVSYCLGITNIDPIQYDLLFERFLNPERISMPDIDIDFCYERRQEVIDYVNEKYGEDHVAQIITFGTLAARAAIKDVGRALNMPYQDVDKVSKMVPFEIGITLKRALEINPELKGLYQQDEKVQYLLDMSMRLEGLPRHASTHAAGVVITDRPVVEYVPLNANDGVITTQFTMNTLEELGLLKMDFLGLRTLTVIQNAVKEIERNHGVSIDIDRIDFADAGVYEMISQGNTEGVFQLESNGMKQFMRELRPESLDDVIAGISLYRPGPMDFIPKYVYGKNHRDNITYTHEALRPILKTTYGCIVYQEQVMQIVRDLAGFSLGRSDLVRRAMSKKKADVMAQERKNFIYGNGAEIPGCVKNGVSEEAANKIFDEMTDFAKYAFNKSHAAAYAVVGYQTAWLKYHYPVEFMAAIMTSVMDHTTKITEYIESIKKMEISLLPPDINEGFAAFSVSGGSIRFGLSAIKNVGRSAIHQIVAEREAGGPFRSLTDFCTRMDSRDLNKRMVESLIKAGAFDSLGGNRAQYMAVYKQIMDGVTRSKKNNLEGQLNLFAMEDTDDSFTQEILPPMEEAPNHELLKNEKEVMGIYVSGHPLNAYTEILKGKVTARSTDFLYQEGKDNRLSGKTVGIGGIIAHKSVKYTRNNQPMAFITLEDLWGSVEVILFPEAYEKFSGMLVEDNVVFVKGRVNESVEEDARLIASKMTPVNELGKSEDAVACVGLVLPKEAEVTFQDISEILQKHRGAVPVYIKDEKSGQKFKTARENWVTVQEGLIQNLTQALGAGNVILKR